MCMNSLWVNLGIRFECGAIRFDEKARFAAIRWTITGDSAEATEDFLNHGLRRNETRGTRQMLARSLSL